MNAKDPVSLYTEDGTLLLEGELSYFSELELEMHITSLPPVSIDQRLQVQIQSGKQSRMFFGTLLNLTRSKLILHHLEEVAVVHVTQAVEERRQMFKISTDLDCLATYVLNEDGQEFLPNKKIFFYVLNISIGGIGFASRTALTPGMLVGFTFPYGARPVDLDVKILRANFDEETQLYVYGGQFLDISPAETDIVNGYIFKKQIALKHKGPQ